jgi:uncharacterized membrane-anchored protein
MSAGAKLLILAVLQGLVLTGMVARHQWTLATGQPVVLAIRPIDPRSLFQGDYVELAYEIGRLRLDRLAGDDDFVEGETVYVELQPGTQAWQPTGVWSRRPIATTGAALRGRIEWVGQQDCEAGVPPCRIAAVHYGIENYFIPEGTGARFETLPAGSRIDVRVAVDRNGTPAIAAILFDGEPKIEEGLF